MGYTIFTDLAPYLLFFCTIFLFGESTPERQLGLQSVRFKQIGAIQLTPVGHVFFFSHPCMVMTWGYLIGLTGLPHQVGEKRGKRVPRTPAWVVLMCRALNGTVHKDWRCTMAINNTIWLFNIANWKIHYNSMEVSNAGKIICFNGPFFIAMSNNQRVMYKMMIKATLFLDSNPIQTGLLGLKLRCSGPHMYHGRCR